MYAYMAEIRKLRKEMQEAYAAEEYTQAAKLARKMIQIYLEYDSCDSMEYASDMHNLAVTLDTIGLQQRALDYYKRAAILKKDASGETLSYADTLNNLAIAYNTMNDTEHALQYHKQTLTIRKNKLGEHHIDTIHSLFHIGNTYEDMKSYTQALQYHQKALELARATKDFPRCDIADILASMAVSYDAMGNYKKAISAYEKALDENEKSMGEKNFPHMIWMLSLAEVCEKAGWYSLAVEYCERAVRIRRSMMRESHLDFVNSLNSLAALCAKAGMFEKALEFHEEVLQLVEQILGKDHLFYADTRNHMSVDYAGMGDYETAKALNLEALHQKQEMLGKEHPQVAISWMTLGMLYEKMGQDLDALEAFRYALSIRQNALGRYHPTYADTLESMAQIFGKVGAYEAAANYLGEAMQLRRDAEHVDDAAYVHTLYLLANMKQKAEENAIAISLCKEAMHRVEEHFGKAHPLYALALVQMGDIYAAQQQYAEAIQNFTQAAAIQKEMLDEDNPQYLHTMERLAEIHAIEGKYDAAITYYLAVHDANFEETPQELLKAAETLLQVACCYLMLEEGKKAAAYHQEAKEKMHRADLPESTKFSTWEQAYQAYLTQGISPFAKLAQPEHIGKKARLRKAADLFTDIFAKQSLLEGFSPQEFARNAMLLGEVLQRLGKYEDARHWYDQAVREAEGMQYAQASQHLGEIYVWMGNDEKAIQKLTNAKNYIEEYDSVKTELYAKILVCLGDCYSHQGEMEKATRFYLPYIRLYRELQLPKDSGYEKRLEQTGRMLKEIGKYQEAAECYSELALCVRAKEGESERFSHLLLKTAETHIAQGNQKEAETLLDRVLLLGAKEGRHTAQYAKLCDKVGRMYAKNGSLERAMDTLVVAYEMARRGENEMTKEARAALLSTFRKLDDQKRYLAAKEGKNLEESC